MMTLTTAAVLGGLSVLFLVVLLNSIWHIFSKDEPVRDRPLVLLGWTEKGGSTGDKPTFLVVEEARTLHLDTIKYRPLEHKPTVEFNPIDPEHLAALFMLRSEPGRQHPTLRFKLNRYPSAYDAAMAAVFNSSIRPAVAQRAFELCRTQVPILKLVPDNETDASYREVASNEV